MDLASDTLERSWASLGSMVVIVSLSSAVRRRASTCGGTGAAIFTFDGQKVHDLRVLGDIYGLVGRIKGGTVEKVEFAVP